MPGEPLMDAYVSEGGETVTFGIDNTTGDDWPAGVFAYEFAVHRDGMLVQGENDALPATGPGVLFLQTRPFLGVEIPGSYRAVAHPHRPSDVRHGGDVEWPGGTP